MLPVRYGVRMATVSDLLLVNVVALRFAAAKIKATPSEVIGWADDSIVGKMRRTAENSGIADGLLDSLTGDVQRVVDEQLASWANVIDVGRKYGFDDNDDASGWLALSWGISDQITVDAGSTRLSWN